METKPLSDAERRLAWEWSDGRYLGDDWLHLLRRVLESEAYWHERSLEMELALKEKF